MRQSIIKAGLDPDRLPDHAKLDLASEAKVWKTIWSAGQGVGAISEVMGANDLCERMIAEYREAIKELANDPFAP
jgi:nitronate monooxygenase